MAIDYTAYPILYVDDEAANLVTVRYALDGIFELLTASSGEEGLRILHERDDIAVLLCDQRMPGMSGVQVCEAAHEMRPDTIRIMITAYADLHAAIEAINRGKVTRYVRKPFRNDELIEILRTAIELVHIQRTVHDMEVRLLQAGQTTGVRTIEAEIAHELGNFVQALEMNVQMCTDLVSGAMDNIERDGQRCRQLLERAHEIHSDAAAGVHQLMTMIARLKQGDLRSFQRAQCYVDRVVDSTVRILRMEVQRVARLSVVTESSPRVPMDASILGQVLMNLLLNAAQAVADVGPDTATITVKVGSAEGRALLSVSDNGPGIADEHIGRIFDPHFTTKEGGNGLGLAIVREMVTEAEGTVTVSTGAAGTTFTVELPVIASSTRPPPPA
jgi:signal transduction histidine kinase